MHGDGIDLAQAEDWVRAGRHADALRVAQARLQSGDDDRALLVMVNAANALGQLDIVIDGLRRLLLRHPLHAQFTRLLATAVNNRGSRARRAGAAAQALADFHFALELAPAHPQAWFNLALCLRDGGREEAAREALQRHLELQPGDDAARLLQATLQGADAAAAQLDGLDAGAQAAFDPGWMAHTAVRADRIDAALEAFDRLQPTHDLGAALEAATELRVRGEPEAATRAAQRLAHVARDAGGASLRAELIAALALPAIYAGADDVLRWRARYADGLSRLEAEWTDAYLRTLAPPLRQLSHSNFLLAYQGGDDCTLQRRFATLVQRAVAASPAAAMLAAPDDTRRGRIGLLSSHWRTSTVGSYFSAWIDWLREAGFEVHVYQLGPQRDAYTDALAARATQFRFLEAPLEDIARTLRDDALDLLLYPEIGMDARMTPLAALRLARVQAVAWGHPVTSGYATMDHYLSCADMEPPDGAAHYVESLHALPGLGVGYRRPARPPVLAPAALGFDPARPRVLVPQSLFKLHPDGDAVMAAIAARVPDVQFVLFAGEHPRWWTRYVERLRPGFARAGRDVDAHLVQLPLGTRERFLQVNLGCDVMLDSLHWSGGNTAIDALSCGLPLVTCPGAQMRGRQSLAMLRRLGLDDALVATTPEAQAERVVALLRDPDERRDLGRTIESRLPQLFESDAARRSLVEWATKVLG